MPVWQTVQKSQIIKYESLFQQQNGAVTPPVAPPRDVGLKSKFTKIFKGRTGATAEGDVASGGSERGGSRGKRQRDEYCVVVPKEGKPVQVMSTTSK